MTEKDKTTFYLVRHGETKWNREGKMQGHSDSPLTEEGKRQAIRLNGLLHDVHFDRVLSSDLPRAVSTARIIIGDSSLEIITTKDLRERSYGSYEGKDIGIYKRELKEQFDIVNNLPVEKRWTLRLAPGIETNQEMCDRFMLCIGEAVKNYTGDTILVSSHGSVIKYSVASLGVVRFHDPHLVINNGCYIKIVRDGSGFKVEEMVGVGGAQ